jgi:hypothetical protein
MRPAPPVPGGSMYFIIKPVKTRANRFKNDTKPKIKFSVFRDIILVPHNSIYHENIAFAPNRDREVRPAIGRAVTH